MLCLSVCLSVHLGTWGHKGERRGSQGGLQVPRYQSYLWTRSLGWGGFPGWQRSLCAAIGCSGGAKAAWDPEAGGGGQRGALHMELTPLRAVHVPVPWADSHLYLFAVTNRK